MPWLETCVVEQRREFIRAWLRERDVSGLSVRFGISRKTGHKLINRFKQHGMSGLEDLSRRPLSSPHATCAESVDAVLGLRRLHPSWGPKKLVAKLEADRPELELPAVSTAGEILKRAGLVEPRRCRRRRPRVDQPWPRSDEPNGIWAVDFKGEFLMGDGQYCYPLTISDEYSRYLLACEGFPRIAGSDVQHCFVSRFRRHGLPLAIRSDNGSPFASTGLCRLSRLSVWWVRLGIALNRNVPGHPEHNGRHERIHRDLKAETTRPPERNLSRQQRRFDAFLAEHNHERPHEALGQQTPARHYRPSPRAYPERLPDIEYPSHYEVRRVAANGCIKLWNTDIFLSQALLGQDIGLIEEDDDRWATYFGSLRLGVIDRRCGRLEDDSDQDDDDDQADTACTEYP
jgi:putative transposase